MNVILSQTSPAADNASAADTAASANADAAVSETIDMVKNFEWAKLFELFLDWLLRVGPKLLLALVFMFIGFKIANVIAKVVSRGLKTAKIDASLSEFLTNVFKFLLKIFVLVLAANIVGIPVSSFIAILGAAGLAVGLALKDGLSNFAGGVVLLLFKPIKVGDLVTIGDHHGHVKSISIFYTIIQTRNDRTVTIPNGSVSNGEVINFSTSPLLRVQALVGIGYGDDIKKARQVMLAQIEKDERIAKNPEPFVVVKELGDNSVNLELRCWTEPKFHRRVLFGLLENIKEDFDANGISIPYPQRDLHIINDDAPAPSPQMT